MPHFKIPQARVYILDLSAHQNTYDHLCALSDVLQCEPHEVVEMLLSYISDPEMARDGIEAAVCEITQSIIRDAELAGRQLSESPVYFYDIVSMGQSMQECIRAAGAYRFPETPHLVCLPFESLRRVVLIPHSEL
jgi:hypothetical protein